MPGEEAKVSAAHAGERLDRFISELAGSRARAQRLIDAGLVRVDGLARPKSHILTGGETVRIEPEPVPAAAPDADHAPHEVAFEDEHLMVIDKPAGVVVHPGRGHFRGTLAQALAGRAAGGEEQHRAGIVHRLDKDTSGLLVVAKSDEAHRRLKALLQARRISREYLALVAGRPESRTGTVEAPIGRHPSDRVRMAIDGVGAREARTHFAVERELARTTLLRVRLDTGRTHQIRVHLAAIGLPVCGDPLYGKPGEHGLDRQFLHATRLAFPHPLTGAEIEVVSALPADLAAALERAERAT